MNHMVYLAEIMNHMVYLAEMFYRVLLGHYISLDCLVLFSIIISGNHMVNLVGLLYTALVGPLFSELSK